jgi:hypothetical protein
MKLNLLVLTLFFLAGIMAACNQNNFANGDKPVKVKVVSLEKCGATPYTIKLVKETADELGLTIDFNHVVVRNVEEAKEHRHIGSPTVQINGVDIDPHARDITQFGIT